MRRGFACTALALAAFGGSARAEDSPPGQWTAPEVNEFSDWSVACDNVRNCTAVSVSRDYVARIAANDPGDYAMPKLWVKRRAGPDARVQVFVDTTVWGEVGESPGPASLHAYHECDGDCTGRAYRLIPVERGRYELSPAVVAAFMAESTASSRAATRFVDGTMHGIISTAGLTAAMRYIDEVQQRRGTVTAIFAKGPRPARAVPPEPSLPRISVLRGEETALEMPVGIAVGVLATRAQLCPEADIFARDALYARYRLSTGQFLLAVGCSGNPHAPRRLWLIETPGQGFAPFLLPRPEQGRPAEMPILPNSEFNPDSGLITAYSDRKCGWRRRWAWTGRVFEMVDAVEMPSCYGIPLHQWLQTYTALPG